MKSNKTMDNVQNVRNWVKYGYFHSSLVEIVYAFACVCQRHEQELDPLEYSVAINK